MDQKLRKVQEHVNKTVDSAISTIRQDLSHQLHDTNDNVNAIRKEQETWKVSVQEQLDIIKGTSSNMQANLENTLQSCTALGDELSRQRNQDKDIQNKYQEEEQQWKTSIQNQVDNIGSVQDGFRNSVQESLQSFTARVDEVSRLQQEADARHKQEQNQWVASTQNQIQCLQKYVEDEQTTAKQLTEVSSSKIHQEIDHLKQLIDQSIEQHTAKSDSDVESIQQDICDLRSFQEESIKRQHMEKEQRIEIALTLKTVEETFNCLLNRVETMEQLEENMVVKNNEASLALIDVMKDIESLKTENENERSQYRETHAEMQEAKAQVDILLEKERLGQFQREDALERMSKLEEKVHAQSERVFETLRGLEGSISTSWEDSTRHEFNKLALAVDEKLAAHAESNIKALREAKEEASSLRETEVQEQIQMRKDLEKLSFGVETAVQQAEQLAKNAIEEVRINTLEDSVRQLHENAITTTADIEALQTTLTKQKQLNQAATVQQSAIQRGLDHLAIEMGKTKAAMPDEPFPHEKLDHMASEIASVKAAVQEQSKPTEQQRVLQDEIIALKLTASEQRQLQEKFSRQQEDMAKIETKLKLQSEFGEQIKRISNEMETLKPNTGDQKILAANVAIIAAEVEKVKLSLSDVSRRAEKVTGLENEIEVLHVAVKGKLANEGVQGMEEEISKLKIALVEQAKVQEVIPCITKELAKVHSLTQDQADAQQKILAIQREIQAANVTLEEQAKLQQNTSTQVSEIAKTTKDQERLFEDTHHYVATELITLKATLEEFEQIGHNFVTVQDHLQKIQDFELRHGQSEQTINSLVQAIESTKYSLQEYAKLPDDIQTISKLVSGHEGKVDALSKLIITIQGGIDEQFPRIAEEQAETREKVGYIGNIHDTLKDEIQRIDDRQCSDMAKATEKIERLSASIYNVHDELEERLLRIDENRTRDTEKVQAVLGTQRLLQDQIDRMKASIEGIQNDFKEQLEFIDERQSTDMANVAVTLNNLSPLQHVVGGLKDETDKLKATLEGHTKLCEDVESMSKEIEVVQVSVQEQTRMAQTIDERVRAVEKIREIIQQSTSAVALETENVHAIIEKQTAKSKKDMDDIRNELGILKAALGDQAPLDELNKLRGVTSGLAPEINTIKLSQKEQENIRQHVKGMNEDIDSIRAILDMLPDRFDSSERRVMERTLKNTEDSTMEIKSDLRRLQDSQDKLDRQRKNDKSELQQSHCNLRRAVETLHDTQLTVLSLSGRIEAVEASLSEQSAMISQSNIRTVNAQLEVEHLKAALANTNNERVEESEDRARVKSDIQRVLIGLETLHATVQGLQPRVEKSEANSLVLQNDLEIIRSTNLTEAKAQRTQVEEKMAQLKGEVDWVASTLNNLSTGLASRFDTIVQMGDRLGHQMKQRTIGTSAAVASVQDDIKQITCAQNETQKQIELQVIGQRTAQEEFNRVALTMQFMQMKLDELSHRVDSSTEELKGGTERAFSTLSGDIEEVRGCIKDVQTLYNQTHSQDTETRNRLHELGTDLQNLRKQLQVVEEQTMESKENIQSVSQASQQIAQGFQAFQTETERRRTNDGAAKERVEQNVRETNAALLEIKGIVKALPARVENCEQGNASLRKSYTSLADKMLGIFSTQCTLTSSLSRDMTSLRTELGVLKSEHLANKQSTTYKQVLLDRIAGALGNISAAGYFPRSTTNPSLSGKDEANGLSTISNNVSVRNTIIYPKSSLEHEYENASHPDLSSDWSEKEDVVSLSTFTIGGRETVTADQSFLSNELTKKEHLGQVVMTTSLATTDSDLDVMSLDESLAEEFRQLFATMDE